MALARTPLPVGAFYEDLCFHAQQAAEKALKAVYLQHGLSFRYSRDLEESVSGLEANGIEVPPQVVDARVLTNFAWEARYPSLTEPVTEDEYLEAIRHAGNVVDWATQAVRTDG